MYFFSMLRSVGSRVLNALKWLFGLAAKTTKMPAWAYQVIHITVVALIAILLAVFSYAIVDPANVGTDVWLIRRCFAGIFFLLLYGFVRLVTYLYGLFLISEESEYPDIDRAWREGLQALEKGGLDLRNIPLFLIVGLSDDEEKQFFSGARFHAKVVAPDADDRRAPVRFFANQDAIFLACSGTSAICRQATAEPEPSAGEPDLAETRTMNREAFRGTMQPGSIGGGATIQPGTATVSQPAAAAKNSPRILTQTELAERRGRLRYLCGLIKRHREPFCPINGSMVVLPVQWTDPGADQDLFRAAREDVAGLHRDLGMLFPVICLFSGLQKLTGLEELMGRARAVDSRFTPNGRAGSRFPIGHEVDEQATRWVVDHGLQWFRQWVYAAFAKDIAHEANTRLYRLLCDLEERREQLMQLVQDVFGQKPNGDVIRLAGCYYSGADASSHRSVFVKDVLDKLVDLQNDVAWDHRRVRSDQIFRTWSYVLYVVLGVLFLADVWLLWQAL